jgi:outer membrane protein TolC
MKKSGYIFFLIVMMAFALNAQTQDDSAEVQTAGSSRFRIPDLNTCIDSALVNSPLLKASDEQISGLLEEIKIQKKSWLNYIFIDANTRYGLFNQLSISQQSSDGANPDQAFYSAKEQFNYFAGVTIRLPLSYFSNNKNEVKLLKQGVKEAELKRDEMKKEITRLVIIEYFKLKSLHELLEIHQNNTQSTRLDYLKASGDLEANMISLTEFATISNQNTKALEAFITAKNDYFAQYYLLKLLTGTNLQSEIK